MFNNDYLYAQLSQLNGLAPLSFILIVALGGKILISFNGW